MPAKRPVRDIFATTLLVIGPWIPTPLALASDIAVRTVLPVAETEAVPAAGDAADDAAIWSNPDNPAASLIIATDKRTGLMVYDLKGRLMQALPVGDLNNVDLRTLGGATVVAASDRTYDAITAFLLDPEDGRLTLAGRFPSVDHEPYGFCLFHERRTGALYAFVPYKSGALIQYRLSVDGQLVTGEPVRRVTLYSQLEGCVADDRTGRLYVGEEAAGIWRLDARPGGSPLIHKVAGTEDDALTADVEGVAIATAGTDGGYLIASSQGDNTYAVYQLPDETLVGRFAIGENAALGIDGTSETDGIDVTTADLGPDFPDGLFVAQDDANDGADTQNFKLVPWPTILTGLTDTP